MGVTNQMKAAEKYFHATLFIFLYKVVLRWRTSWESETWLTVQSLATGQYLHVVSYMYTYM